MWIEKYLTSLNRTGKLVLIGEDHINMSDIKTNRMMKLLNISRTKVSSIVGLNKQPKLETFIADNTGIDTVENFSAISSARSISLRNTPISSKPNFELTVYLATDRQIRILNDKLISSATKTKAEQYPPCVTDLLNSGWILQYPCPDPEELNRIAKEYGLEPAPTPQSSDADPPSVEIEDCETFRDVISSYIDLHDKMIWEQLSRFGVTSDSFLTFEDKLRDILKSHGVPLVTDGEDNELLDTIALLCERERSSRAHQVILE